MSEERIMNEYGPRLSHLEGQVGGLSVQVQGLSAGMTELGHKLDRLFEKTQNQPVNWGWLTTGVVSLGAFIMLYTAPLEKSAIARDEKIHELTEQVMTLREKEAYQQAQVDHLEEELRASR